MDWKQALVFLVTYTLVYVAVSWLASGSIYWVGLIGGLIGASIAFTVISRWRKGRGSSASEHN